jgi:hypothetical protein
MSVTNLEVGGLSASIDESIRNIKALASASKTSSKPRQEQRLSHDIVSDRSYADHSLLSMDGISDRGQGSVETSQGVDRLLWEDARQLADHVYQVVAGKLQVISEANEKIYNLEFENNALRERLNVEIKIKEENERKYRQDNLNLQSKLDATTQAAAQLHAQQSNTIQEQAEKIEQLQQDILRQRLPTLSSNIPSNIPLFKTKSPQQPTNLEVVLGSSPSAIESLSVEANGLKAEMRGITDENRGLLPKPRTVRRGRPPTLARVRNDKEASSDGSALTTRRVLHSMDEPIRAAGAGSFAAGDQEPPSIKCTYTSEFDTCGVFYYLGRKDDGGWENPASTGRVAVYCGEGGRGKELFAGERKENVLERSIRGDSSGCFAFAEGWFAVWLGAGTRLQPSHYTVRNGGGCSCAMTSWVLEARTPHPHHLEPSIVFHPPFLPTDLTCIHDSRQ